MARTKTNKGVLYNKYMLHYDSDFKWRVCQEYLNGKETKLAAQQRNDIKAKTAIIVWLRQFGLKDKLQNIVNDLFQNSFRQLQLQFSNDFLLEESDNCILH
jgi:hypothetical protein